MLQLCVMRRVTQRCSASKCFCHIHVSWSGDLKRVDAALMFIFMSEWLSVFSSFGSGNHLIRQRTLIGSFLRQVEHNQLILHPDTPKSCYLQSVRSHVCRLKLLPFLLKASCRFRTKMGTM